MKLQTLAAVTALILFALMGCKGQNRVIGDVNGSSASPTPPGATQVINYQTTSQTMNATGTAKTLTWNLGTQIQGTSPLPGGGTLTIKVQVFTSGTGQTSYQFSSPTITGGSSAILVQNVGFVINGQPQAGASTYWGVNRMIPASPANRVLSTTPELVPFTIAASDTVAITFATLQPTTFAPPTYTQLTGAGGVFANNCQGCHSSGTNNPPGNNLDLTKSTAAYNHLITYFEAVPYQPGNSLIIEHVTAAPGYSLMPQGGPMLSGALIQQISDWINDGAPNN